MADVHVGTLLRDWRRRRRLSQLELALDAGVSARHVSFVETGRAKPSREMVLHLAEELQVPLRDRNRLMLAAGFAPVYGERPLDGPDMAPVRAALDRILAGHDPYPAVAVDRMWNLVAGNRALDVLVDGVAPELLAPPANALRIALHPEGLAPRTLNLGEWRAHLLARVERQLALTGSEPLAQLFEEVRSYPGPEPDHAPSPDAIFVELRVRVGGHDLTFFSTISTFGTAVDITVAELSIESFFPADAETGEALRALTARSADAPAPVAPAS